MSENNDLGAFLAGFVIGGLVGAATALILAPQSGEEMRTQLANKSQEWRQTGGERVHEYRELAGNMTQDIRGRAGQSFSEAGVRVQEQARIVLDSGKDRATQMKEQVSALVQKENEGSDAAEENASSAE